MKPNAFYELGFADGAGREVVLVAKKGTELLFNVADVPVIFWDSFEDFKQDLRKRLKGLSAYHDRRIQSQRTSRHQRVQANLLMASRTG